jgi:hypothetical protein
LPLDQIKTVWRKTKDTHAHWEVSIIGVGLALDLGHQRAQRSGHIPGPGVV